jgi:imidazolonepropionase-like amidohydrolase
MGDWGCRVIVASPRRQEIVKRLLLALRVIVPVLLVAGLGANQPRLLVFTHVTLIDPAGGPTQPDMSVIVTNDRITEIGRTGAVSAPQTSRVVDAAGKYMIPGLWDMHIHWYDRDYLSLFIANGVTGVRQMWGMPQHHAWRKAIESGTLLGPRMVIASPILDGPNPIWPMSVSVATEAEGRSAVHKFQQEGADFIKVYSRLPKAVFFAIADETKKQGLSFAGHVPRAVSAADASDAGQKSIEHLTGILEASSDREEELHEQIEALSANLPAGQRLPGPVQQRPISRMMIDTFSAEKAATLFARFRRNGTWQTPTMTVLRSTAFLDDPTFRNDPRLKYVPTAVKGSWNPANDFRFRQKTAEDFELARAVYRKQVDVVGMMARANVGILAGTDVLNPFCFPGFSLHDELRLLVQAGLTPLAALQSATLNPARFLGREKDLGTIEKGKLADLVVLDANPLADIGNTGRIHAVLVGGRLLNRKELDELLVAAEAAANRR